MGKKTTAVYCFPVGWALAVLLFVPAVVRGQYLPDLRIVKQRAASSAAAGFARGNELSYEVVITNIGTATASDLRMTDTLPEHTTYLSAIGGLVVLGGPDRVVMVWDHLEAAGSLFAVITLRVNEDAPFGASVTNHASVICLDPEQDYSNNEAFVPETVVTPPALTATMRVDGQLHFGGAVQYTVVLANIGPVDYSDGSSDEYVNVLPPGIALLGASVAGGGGIATADVLGNTVTWNGAIAAGGSVTLTISGRVRPLIDNQGMLSFDTDDDGAPDAELWTDDPTTPELGDPTVFYAYPVPSIFSCGFECGNTAAWSVTVP